MALGGQSEAGLSFSSFSTTPDMATLQLIKHQMPGEVQCLLGDKRLGLLDKLLRQAAPVRRPKVGHDEDPKPAVPLARLQDQVVEVLQDVPSLVGGAQIVADRLVQNRVFPEVPPYHLRDPEKHQLAAESFA